MLNIVITVQRKSVSELEVEFVAKDTSAKLSNPTLNNHQETVPI